MINLSVGIMAHNEEALIAKTICSIQNQVGTSFVIKEIIVVATDCTDMTVLIVQDLAKSDHRIKIITEDIKAGKIFSVINYLENAASKYCIISSGDVFPEEDVFEKLTSCIISNSKIAMVGARVVPLIPPRSRKIAHKLVNMSWDLHHRIAIISPKLGELVLVDKTFMKNIPSNSGCDEVMLEVTAVHNLGELFYVENAIIHNQPIGSIQEIFDAHRRIHFQHKKAWSLNNYTPATYSIHKNFSIILSSLKFHKLKSGYLILLGILIISARVFSNFDYWNKRDVHNWKPTETTRSQIF